jgi:hypothetical protein
VATDAKVRRVEKVYMLAGCLGEKVCRFWSDSSQFLMMDDVKSC